MRYAFDLFDVDGSGQLETAEIKRLVCYVAGSKKPDARSAKVLKLMDSDNDGQISFPEFVRYNRKFPSILFPAFSMQQKMRFKVLGLPFWQAKTIEMAKLKSTTGLTVMRLLEELGQVDAMGKRAAERAVRRKTAKKGKEKVEEKEKVRERVLHEQLLLCDLLCSSPLLQASPLGSLLCSSLTPLACRLCRWRRISSTLSPTSTPSPLRSG